MTGHSHGTAHDFGIGGCLNPFGGQICRCGAVSSCGVYQDFAFAWVDITTSGTLITAWEQNADDGWKHIDLPFNFPWYGAVETRITVGTNGVITFVIIRNTSKLAQPLISEAVLEGLPVFSGRRPAAQRRCENDELCI